MLRSKQRLELRARPSLRPLTSTLAILLLRPFHVCRAPRRFLVRRHVRPRLRILILLQPLLLGLYPSPLTVLGASTPRVVALYPRALLVLPHARSPILPRLSVLELTT